MFVISDFVRVERMPGFSCELCAQCCKGRIIVLYDRDVERLLEAGFSDFYEEAGELELRLTGAKYRMKLKENGECIFLEDDRCVAYEYRPDTCRRYPFIVGEDFILASISCPGIKWDEEGDAEPFREPSKEISKVLRRIMRI